MILWLLFVWICLAVMYWGSRCYVLVKSSSCIVSVSGIESFLKHRLMLPQSRWAMYMYINWMSLSCNIQYDKRLVLFDVAYISIYACTSCAQPRLLRFTISRWLDVSCQRQISFTTVHTYWTDFDDFCRREFSLGYMLIAEDPVWLIGVVVHRSHLSIVPNASEVIAVWCCRNTCSLSSSLSLIRSKKLSVRTGSELPGNSQQYP